MSAIFSNLNYHLIFSTHERKPLLDDDLQRELFKAMKEIVKTFGGHLIVAGGGPEHVHLLMHYPPEVSPAEIQLAIKQASADWLAGHSQELDSFQWQPGYLCFTVSQSRLEHVETYIANQPTHHTKWDYEREVVMLLDANHCPYDEKGLWK